MILWNRSGKHNCSRSIYISLNTAMRPPYKNPGYTPRNVKGVWRGWGWFIIPEWNITIAAPPKCGSSSLKQFFHSNEMDNVTMVPHHVVNPKSEIYFIVRHPIDRFISLWKSKCRDKANIIDKTVHGMTANQLMDYIIAGNKDVHWTPQIELLGELNATLIPMEKLNEWWKNNNFGNLNTFNATTGKIVLSEDLKQRICKYYEKDDILYKTAVENYNA